MSSDTSRLREFLESNPKWIGILFSAMLLLSQVGAAAAATGGTTRGP